MVSIIIPTLNEEQVLGSTLAALMGLEAEILVADGGSADRTVAIARGMGARVIACERGRGVQMHTAALAAGGDVLWFLHADTVAEAGTLAAIRTVLADPAVVGGNCAVVFDGDCATARQMTWIYPRLRWLGLYYGDSGLFVRRGAYEAIGGFRPYPLFEDIDLVRRLREIGRMAHVAPAVRTSSRRFQGRRYLAVWAQWITLQVLYWAGVSPHRLARLYGARRSGPARG